MARYNYSATIINNTEKTLIFAYYCKGTDDNPSGEGTVHGNLYHGEIVTGPTFQIPPNREGSFTAKSTGSTIQGTVVYKAEGWDDIWIYFHVPDLGTRHDESAGVAITINDDSKHAIATYLLSTPT